MTAPAGCPWQVQNLPNWLSASPASSSGTGNVTLTAQLNPGAQRQASVLIAGQTVIVIQPEAPAPPAPCTVSISPTSLSFSAAGGTGTVNIIAPANCPITVQSDVPWILIGAGTSGTGITSVTFTVQANTGAARMGNIRVDGQTLVVTQQGAPDPDCNFTVTPSGTNFPASGGTGTANVSTQAGCPWSAQSFVDWITISGEAGFRGSGTATFIVGPNPAPGERSGAVRIADKIVTITQSGACTFTVFPSNVTVASAGGTASVTVTAPAGCSWQVQNLPIWLSASPVNGSGTGTVTLTAQPNPGGQQQASVLIAGQTVTVVQPAAAPDPCIYTVTGATPSYNFSPSGGNGTVNVTTNLAQCSWSAQSLVDWITITGPAGFTGSENAAFQVAANSSPQSRQGQLRVAGQLVTITQSGVGTVIVQLQGSGSGQISSVPAGMTCSATTCTGTLSAGSQVTLNAVADPFARFDGWTGSCAQFKTGTCVLTVPAGTISSGATFTALPTLDVVTDNVGNAGGNVSSLRLFNCDRHGQPPQSGTCSATLVTGTVLTLFAGFDFPSSEFNGFQGCDTVDVEDMSCTITVTRGARTVRVSFVPAGLPTSAVSGFISAPALQTVPIALFWGLADADQISPLGSDR